MYSSKPDPKKSLEKLYQHLEGNNGQLLVIFPDWKKNDIRITVYGQRINLLKNLLYLLQ